MFFKMIDKIDPIITVWRYLNYYRGKIDDIDNFLLRLRDFFEYPVVVKYSTSTQFGHQLPDLLSTLLNKKLAKQYYYDSSVFEKQQGLYSFEPSIIKKFIEGCPLFLDE